MATIVCRQHYSMNNHLIFTETISTDVAPVDSEEDEDKERHCDSLIMCIVTTLNEGLRNGGGIGDVLRKPSRTVSIVGFFRMGHFLRAHSH